MIPEASQLPRFIKRFIRFCVAVFVGLSFVVVFSNVLVDGLEKPFKMDPSIKKVFLGHSHTDGAYNDSLIAHSRNLAQSGEAYFYTYLKAKKILEHNPQIEHIFIEYSNNQIDQAYNSWIWEDQYINYRLTKYMPYLDVNDYLVLLEHNPKATVSNLPLSTKENLELLLKTPEDMYKNKRWGGYVYRTRNAIDSFLVVKQSYKDDSYIFKGYSKEHIMYLQKIIDLTQKYQKQLVLIRTPVHERYQPLVNEPFFKRLTDSLFANHIFLDFVDYPLYNEAYADHGHMNFKGANEFSIWFDSLWTSKILLKPNPQKSIDSIIKIKKNQMQEDYNPNMGYKRL